MVTQVLIDELKHIDHLGLCTQSITHTVLSNTLVPSLSHLCTINTMYIFVPCLAHYFVNKIC